MEQSNRISIIVADDAAIEREGIVAICRTHPRVDIAGFYSDGMTALEMIQSLRPDIAIFDLNLSNLHGLELARRVRQTNAETRLIALSASRDPKAASELFRAGANAFLPKDGSSQHLIDAIDRTMDGGIYVSPLIEASRVFGLRQAGSASDLVDALSTREYEVFLLLVEGLDRKEIARRLAVGPKRVNAYRTSLMRKLDIHDVAGLVKFAIRRKLIPTP